jgi:hypothetical protein
MSGSLTIHLTIHGVELTLVVDPRTPTGVRMDVDQAC